MEECILRAARKTNTNETILDQLAAHTNVTIKDVRGKRLTKKTVVKRYLNSAETTKLEKMANGLETASERLKLLLVEANNETIKENIPKLAREKCMDTWYKTNETYWNIQKSIVRNTCRMDIKRELSAGEVASRKTAAMIVLLQAILDCVKERPQ